MTPSFPSQGPAVPRCKAPATRQRSPSVYESGPRSDEEARGAGNWTLFLRSVSPINARSTLCSVRPVNASCSMSHVNLGKMSPGVSWQLTVTLLRITRVGQVAVLGTLGPGSDRGSDRSCRWKPQMDKQVSVGRLTASEAEEGSLCCFH